MYPQNSSCPISGVNKFPGGTDVAGPGTIPRDYYISICNFHMVFLV